VIPELRPSDLVRFSACRLPNKPDRSRVFTGGEDGFDVVMECCFQRVTGLLGFGEDDERLHDPSPLLVRATNDGDLRDRILFREGVLHLQAGNGGPGGDDEVIPPWFIHEPAVSLVDEDDPREAPSVLDRLGLFLRPIPVGNPGRAADRKQAGFAPFELHPCAGIDDCAFISRNGVPPSHWD